MRQIKRIVLVALSALALLGLGAGPASASWLDDLKDILNSYTTSEETEQSAEDAAARAVAKDVCGKIAADGSASKDCITRLSKNLTPEEVANGADALCKKGPDTVGWRLRCEEGLREASVQSTYLNSYEGYLDAHAKPIADSSGDREIQGGSSEEDEASGASGNATGKTTPYIEDPESDFEEFVNTVKEDALSLASPALQGFLAGSGFSGGENWFRDAWAPMAAIGLALLALSFLLLQRSLAAGTVTVEQYDHSISTWLPISIFVLFFGPPLGYVVGLIVDSLTSGVGNWLGPSVGEFITSFTGANSLQAESTPGGVMSGMIVFALMLIAGLGLMVTLLIQHLSIHVLGLVVGVAAGLILHPTWRAKAMRIPMVWLGFMLAKPVMLLVMGLVVLYVSNAGEIAEGAVFQQAGDGVSEFIAVLLQIIAMLTIAFGPLTLLKFFPLLPDGGEVETVGSTGGGHGAATAAGATARAVDSARHRIRSSRSRQSSVEAASEAAPTASSGQQSGSGSRGMTGKSPYGSGPDRVGFPEQGGRGKPAAVDGAASAEASSGKAGTTAGKSAATSSTQGASKTRASGTAAKSAAGKGGRLVSSGALFAAAVTAKAASYGVQKGRQMSDSAAPSMNSRTKDMT